MKAPHTSIAAYMVHRTQLNQASLQPMMRLVQPHPSWRVLDVATGTGSVALALAPHVAQVTAVDITPAMLAMAHKNVVEEGYRNIRLQLADAHSLPFEPASFDLVTCRMAAHHFLQLDRFLAEVRRLLCPQGQLLLADMTVPGSRLHGKKAQRQREAGAYINAMEKLRDPSHGRFLSVPEWQDALQLAGFTGLQETAVTHDVEFEQWLAQTQVDAQNRLRLRAMVLQAPEPVQAFLTPQMTGDRITVRLTETIFLASKVAPTVSA